MESISIKNIKTLSGLLKKVEIFKSKGKDIPRKTVILCQIAFAKEVGFCEKCGSTDSLTADHIIPAVLLESFGYNVNKDFRVEWYQCLCYPCNSKKSHIIDWSNYRTTVLFRKLFREKGVELSFPVKLL
jgi:5-methylcytosine-specific restriction endonuclease McrA